ncbi:MAG: DNA glycosylase [Citromicrobium sp.]|nr:DNA glycosylase [Citromicrobium sp.]
MGLSATQIRDGLDAVAERDARVARALAIAGYPEPRIRERGHRTLLRTIVGQQVSVAAADSVWAKLEAEIGSEMAPEKIVGADFDTLRACGLSRQKQGYARSLCELVAAKELDLANLPEDDEAAIAELTKIKGIGRWSAEIYLLFAEGRPDIWPAGDLAVQKAVGRIAGLEDMPSEKETRAIAQDWQPHRGAMAIFTWHAYSIPTL